MQIDEQERQVRQFECPCCATPAERTWTSIHRGGKRHAVYFASCYHHGGVHEVWIDVVLGWSDSGGFGDHVTFGCRVGPIEGEPTPAASLVRGGDVADDSPIYGRKLDREAALAHPRLQEFWDVVDHVLEHDKLVNQHIYGRPVTD